MSRWLFVTDTHFRAKAPIHRKDDFLKSILKKMEFVLDFAKKCDAKIIHGGDLFHSPSPSDYVGSAVASLFDKYGIDVYYIIGNHDCLGGNINSYDYGKLGMFEYYKWFHFLGKEIFEFDDCYLFGFDFNKSCECPTYIGNDQIENETCFLKQNKFEKKKFQICCVHCMITDNVTINIEGKIKAINWKEISTPFDVILTGHYHPGFGIKKNSMNSYIINPGALARLEATDEMINKVPQIVFMDLNYPNIKIKIIPVEYEKDVFDVEKVKYQKILTEEENRFIAALESIKDEDIMSGNVLSILENLTSKNLPEHLKEYVSDRILRICKDKIKEVSDGKQF